MGDGPPLLPGWADGPLPARGEQPGGGGGDRDWGGSGGGCPLLAQVPGLLGGL